jgi:hypothetical protein
MADNIVAYLQPTTYLSRAKSRDNLQPKVIAYVRGAYLEAVRLANKKLQPTTHDPQTIIELFDDDELAQLKKKGIMWMKVGLRIPTAFIAFRIKMRCIVEDADKDSARNIDMEGAQLKLF